MAAVKIMLSEKYGIKSEFVRIDTLAAVMGIDTGTIRAQMRRDTFCLPFRQSGSIALVKVEDLVEWYNDGRKVREKIPAPNAEYEVNRGDVEPIPLDVAREPSRAELVEMVKTSRRDELIQIGLAAVGCEKAKRRARARFS